MGDRVEKVTIMLALQDLISGGASGKVRAELASIEQSAKGIGSAFSSVAGIAAGFFGLVAGAEGLSKAVELAKEAQDAQDRLTVALGGSEAQYRRFAELAQQSSAKTVYGVVEIEKTITNLINRGVSLNQIPAALNATIQTATALKLPLDEISNQIAGTLGGTVPKALAKAVPALKDLSKEALENGDAFDVLTKRYNGFAEAFAKTDSGKMAAAQRDVNQAYEDFGKALIPIEASILPTLSKAMSNIAELFKPDPIYTWKNVLKNAAAEVAGDIGGFANAQIKIYMGVGEWLVYKVEEGIAWGKSVFIELLAFVADHFSQEIQIIAAQIDRLTAAASRIPGLSGLKTNLAGTVSSALSPATLNAARAGAAADVASWSAKAKGVDLGFSSFGDNFDAGKSAVMDRIGAGIDGGGTGGINSDIQTRADARQTQQHAQAVSDRKEIDADARKDDLAAEQDYLNAKSNLNKEAVAKDQESELAQAKAMYEQKKLTVQQYAEERTRIEIAPLDAEIQKDQQSVAALKARLEAEKAAGEHTADTYRQLARVTADLIPLEEKRAALAAEIAAEQQKNTLAQAKGAQADAKSAIENLHDQVALIAQQEANGSINVVQGYQRQQEAVAQYTQSIVSAEAEIDALRARITDPAQQKALDTIKLHIEVDAEKALKDVPTIAQEIRAGLDKPLESSMDKFLMTQGTMQQRLRAATQSFLQEIQSMLAQYAAKMATSALLTRLFGPPPGETGVGEGSGGGGQGLLGGLINKISGGNLFGGGSVGPSGGDGDAADLNADAAGGGDDLSVSGGLLGDLGNLANGAGNVIGGAASAVGQAAGNVASGAGNVLGGIFGAIAGAFAGGGDPPVGKMSLVGEKGPELFMPSVQGRIYSAAQLQDIMRSASAIRPSATRSLAGGSLGSGIAEAHLQAANALHAAASRLSSPTIIPAVPITEDLGRQIINHPGSINALAELLTTNPKIRAAKKS